MRLPKFIYLILAILLLAFTLAGCAQQQKAPDAGGETKVVQGEAFGYNADTPIKVEVKLVDGKISEITVLDHGETPGISDPAFAQIPAAIIEKQSTSVDVVTGATKTSEGIMEAVANALAK